MMKILGVDYGRSKIGLARAEGPLAEPFKVIKVNSFDDAVQKLKREIEIEKADKIVVGVSEGAMGEESKEFAKAFGADIFDETLSTYEAQEKSIQGGIGRKKRREMEDAYAATVMLQNYLDLRQDG